MQALAQLVAVHGRLVQQAEQRELEHESPPRTCTDR
jgi:hypothetical protein